MAAPADHGAPQGATCAEHPERPAAFTCPRCGNYACIFCFHPAALRCESCLRRDPAAAAPALPWETARGSAVGRYLRTLATAFTPTATAPAFARPELRPALRFFALTALPLAALAGVIPHTKTLLFGGSLAVTIVGKPTAAEIALDVVVAMLVELGLFALDCVALGTPYVSLVRAYTSPERRAAALRVLCYRLWLIPAASLLFFAGMWLAPPAQSAAAPPPALQLLVLGRMVFDVLLLIALRTVARLACGIRPLLSFAVVAVPAAVWFMMLLLVARVAAGAP